MNTPAITAGVTRRAATRRKAFAGPVLVLALLLAGLAAAAPSAARTVVPGPSSSRLSTPAALIATLQGTFTGKATTTMYDQLGTAVALSGDTALVGAQYFQEAGEYARGEVYVYVRSNGTWSQQAVLRAPDETDGSYFGCTVAIDGDTAVIGAYGHLFTAGSVYVFVRSGTTWTLQQRLDGLIHSQLGWSVAVSGDTLLAGAYVYSPSDDDTVKGAARVYTRAGGVWSLQQQLMANDAAANDHFGFAVGLSGDCAVVGAPFRNGGIPSGAGAAYVFARSGSAWSQQLKVTGAAGDNLGRSVAVSGRTALVGVPMASSYIGKVMVLADTGGGWAKQTEFASGDSAGGDLFGWSVALDGSRAVIGAMHKPTGGMTRAGEAYVFAGSGASWAQQAEVDPPTATIMAQFGYAVALEGDTMLVGEPSQSNHYAGKAYAYGLSQPVDTTPPVTVAHVAPARWTNKPVTVTLTATDDISGVAGTEYRVQDAPSWQTYVAPFQVTAQGVTTYLCHSTDVAGHLETPDVVFKVRRDTLGPRTLALAKVTARAGKRARFRFRVNDLTPKATVWLKVFKGKRLKKTAKLGSRATNRALSCTWKCGLARGTYTWKVFATDQAGNRQRSMTSKRLVVK